MKKIIICLVVIVTGIFTAGCKLNQAPDAPVIKFTANSSTIYTIKWDAVAGAEEYYVYMRSKYVGETSADPNSLIMSYITTSTEMAFRRSGYTFYFAVKAGNSAGVSGFSNVVSN